jgi:hypothetical protein
MIVYTKLPAVLLLEDGTVYHCGDYEVASYKDGFFLCSKHAED